MGYRSEVQVLIYPDVDMSTGKCDDEQEQLLYDQLKVFMATTFKQVTDEEAEYMTWIDAHRVLKFVFDGVKWYPNYTSVQRFTAMLDAFRSEELAGYCTEFVRIGEDDDDTETTYSGNNNEYHLGVSRAIRCNL